jgi:nucleoside-diphosphate-sugar epimerase
VKVFVAGATGVIGRRAVPLLVASGHAVTAVARSRAKAQRLSAGARTVAVSLFDPPALARAVGGHDVVINLATHMPSSSLAMALPWSWRENDRIRREGAANLAQAAIAGGATRLLQESFAPVYPDCGEAWITEQVAIAPERYNRTVADAERAAEKFTGGGRSGIVLRFAAFYGADAMQLRDLVRALHLRLAPLPSEPQAFISSISHDDAASAVVACLNALAGAYNITDDEPLTRRDYFGTLAKLIGARPPWIPPKSMAPMLGSAGKLMARSQRMANGKVKAATGWAPQWRSVREGFAAVVREWREGAEKRASI